MKDALIGDTYCDRDHRPELTIMLTLEETVAHRRK
jgi:hypothetical protein